MKKLVIGAAVIVGVVVATYATVVISAVLITHEGREA